MGSLLPLLLILIGAALILDTLFIASRHTIDTGVVMPALLGLPLLAWGLLRPAAAAAWPVWPIRLIDVFLAVAYAAFAISFLTVIALIRHAPSKSVPAITDALVILGAALKGQEVSRTLDQRLRQSAGILRQHPGLRAVVSGGLCPGGARTEAAAMAERLEHLGIARDRIILEDQSQSTVENLTHCLPLLTQILGRAPRMVAIVTSDYHVYRALLMARRLGYNAIGIAAPAARENRLNNLLREYIAIGRYLLAGR